MCSLHQACFRSTRTARLRHAFVSSAPLLLLCFAAMSPPVMDTNFVLGALRSPCSPTLRQPLGQSNLMRRAAGPINPATMSRDELKSALFSCLDMDSDRRLNSREMRSFAELSGFEGDDEEWAEVYSFLCGIEGCNLATFGGLLDDDSDDGIYCSDVELVDAINECLSKGATISSATSTPPSGRSLGAARSASMEHFAGERRAGLYDGEWKAWDPTEGVKARSPRVGSVPSLAGCPSSSTAQEAIMFANEQMMTGIFGDQTGTAGERLSGLMALQGNPGAGAGWFEFRVDENAVDEDDLADLVLAPEGWTVDRSTIPKGYMMHIMSVGNGVKATLCGRENVHIINSLHRDVSKCKRLCDTCLCGVVGRKRVILFAPDEFPADPSFARKPDMSSSKLQSLTQLPEEEAWRKLEELASREDVKGGVLNLEPGKFFFVPHGWWHAVRPIDDFTFITGPSQLSNFGVQTE